MKYKLTPARKGNRLDSSLNSSKTKKLGWKPKHNLKTYLINETAK